MATVDVVMVTPTNKPPSKRSRLLWVVLFGLLGLGLAALAWGLQLGAAHRQRVLDLEARFLDLPPPPAIQGAPASAGAVSQTSQTSQAAAPASQPPGTRPPAQPPQPGQPAWPTAGAQVAADAGQADPGAASPSAPMAAPAAPAAQLGTPMPPATGDAVPAVAAAAPVRIRVKVLVDERWVSAQPQWLTAVQRVIALASRAYENRAGIELVLSGVVRWPTALDGLDPVAVHADLCRRPREGADILLGFLGVPLPSAALSLGAPRADSPLNGACALVAPSTDVPDPHLHGTLRAIGVLLGARPIADSDADAGLGSWMADGPLRTREAPWLDLPNLERIHARRGRPFEVPAP